MRYWIVKKTLRFKDDNFLFFLFSIPSSCVVGIYFFLEFKNVILGFLAFGCGISLFLLDFILYTEGERAISQNLNLLAIASIFGLAGFWIFSPLFVLLFSFWHPIPVGVLVAGIIVIKMNIWLEKIELPQEIG